MSNQFDSKDETIIESQEYIAENEDNSNLDVDMDVTLEDFELVDLVEEIEELDLVDKVGQFIRDNSYLGNLTNAENLLEEPFSLDVEEIHPLLEELKERESFSDIRIKQGKEHIYLFSENYITENYSKMMILVEEKNLLILIAETVRDESKVYPRPTDSKLFSKRPFNLTRDEFTQVYEILKKDEEYSDIQETRASNNALYLYSNKYMKHAHAARLAEWIEVEAEQNP